MAHAGTSPPPPWDVPCGFSRDFLYVLAQGDPESKAAVWPGACLQVRLVPSALVVQLLPLSSRAARPTGVRGAPSTARPCPGTSPSAPRVGSHCSVARELLARVPAGGGLPRGARVCGAVALARSSWAGGPRGAWRRAGREGVAEVWVSERFAENFYKCQVRRKAK